MSTTTETPPSTQSPAPAWTPPDHRAEGLMYRAHQAAVIRAHRTDPNVIALAVTKITNVIEVFMWLGILLGLGFTTVTVQHWGALGMAVGSMEWWSMWLLAPLVEIPLLTILIGEAVAVRHDVQVGDWVRRARWILLAFAYLMNTYGPWASVLGGQWGFDDLIKHSVPPLAVLLAAEAVTDLRETLRQAVTAAAERAERALAEQERQRANEPKPRRRQASPSQERKPERQAPLPPPLPLADPDGDDSGGRTLREIGVEWALANWRDDLRPVEIGEAMMSNGTPISKGERSKIRDAAAEVIAARRAEPLSTSVPDRGLASAGATP